MPLYGVNGEAVSGVYTVDGTPISISDIPSPNIVDDAVSYEIFRSTTTGQTQGYCMDNSGNIYGIYYKLGKFVRYNVDTKTETIFNTFTSGSEVYGHANGMAYNPYTDRIYIAPSLNTGEVYVINPTTLELDTTLYAYQADGVTPINVWNICYNRTARKFICLSQGTIYFYNDNFTLASTASYTVEDWKLTRQDIETDGEYIYASSAYVTVSGVAGVDNAVYVFTMDGELVGTSVFDNQTDELEDVCYDWRTGLFYSCYARKSGGTGAKIDLLNMKAFYSNAETESIIEVV